MGVISVEEVLAKAKEAGASDVHITVGVPPKMRVNGDLITMDYERMLPPDTHRVVEDIMSDFQLQRFEERGEYDMSFSIPNIGRYRVNAYKQRGSVAVALRLVGTEIPAPESLGVPPSVVDRPEAVNPPHWRRSLIRSTIRGMHISSHWKIRSSICIPISFRW